MRELAIVFDQQQHMLGATAIRNENRPAECCFFGPARIVIELTTGKSGDWHDRKLLKFIDTLLQFKSILQVSNIYRLPSVTLHPLGLKCIALPLQQACQISQLIVLVGACFCDRVCVFDHNQYAPDSGI